MKATAIISVLALFFTTHSFSQDKTDLKYMDGTKGVEVLGYQITDSNPDAIHFSSPVTRFKDSIDAIQKRYLEKNPKGKNIPLFDNSTLNLLFTDKIGTAFGSSNDLVLQKYYFALDANDKSLSLAYNIDNRGGEELDQLNWVFSAGAKIVSKDKFATVFKSDDFLEDNIGITLKAAWVGNGRINWGTAIEGEDLDTDHRLAIEENRKFLYHKYNEKVKNYNKSELEAAKQYANSLQPHNEKTKKLKKVLEKKSDELLVEMIKEELKYIDDNGLYNHLKNHWATFELFIPVGDTFYDITPITNDNKSSKAQYYAFELSSTYNWFRQYSKGFSYFATIEGSIKGNNNIVVNGLTAQEFQSITTDTGAPVLTSPVSAIAIDKYDRFITTSIKAETAFFFFNNTIGFSPAIEKNFGTYDGVNWKLGIPVSLKDKEGKPTINFEVQWREDKTLSGNRHLIGISTSFLFGKLTNN